ncbi:aspartyl-phosphate phosphatase Spo0E family protein [Anaeromicrobium sediminis]|uniref:Spo0E family sporulation regulatory protein-aspartic acid phosphatase n=1 Tax=Anaeromicrobium sediminis TaxID=1478221 RepID=A0A267MKC2_9FIRM|nr:aspartyl-phosphate phosphatase Spo0E family protein [Anaeromicrobium sediminis]PAB60029.1 hypothetical protein CCE28_06545 [Anaeromicrobium sediminis]
MTSLKEISLQIQHLKRQLHCLIEQNDNLIAEEIVSLSQSLDTLLNSYNNEHRKQVLGMKK